METSEHNTILPDVARSSDERSNTSRLKRKASVSFLEDGSIELFWGLALVTVTLEGFLIESGYYTSEQYTMFCYPVLAILTILILTWLSVRQKKYGIALPGAGLVIGFISCSLILFLGSKAGFYYAPLVSYLMISALIIFGARLKRGYLYIVLSFIAFYIAAFLVHTYVDSSRSVSDWALSTWDSSEFEPYWISKLGMLIFHLGMALIGLVAFTRFLGATRRKSESVGDFDYRGAQSL